VLKRFFKTLWLAFKALLRFLFSHRPYLALLLILAALMLLDGYCEYNRVPGFLQRRVLGQLAGDGLEVRCGTLRAGLLNGIVAEDVEILWPESHLPVFRATRFSCDSLQPALKRFPRHGLTLRLEGGELRLPWQKPGSRPLTLANLEAIVHVRNKAKSIAVEKLTAIVGGIQLKTTGTLETGKPETGAAPAAPPSIADLAKTLRDTETHLMKFQVTADTIHALLQRQHFDPNSTTLEWHFAVDLAKPDPLQFEGNLSCPDLTLENQVIRKIKCQFGYTAQMLDISNLEVQLGGFHRIEAELAYHLKRQSLEARLRGSVDLNTLSRLLGDRYPEWFSHLETPEPLVFSSNLLFSKLGMDKLVDVKELLLRLESAAATLDATNLNIRKQPFRSLHTALIWKDQSLVAKDLRLTVNSDEYATAEVTWNRDQGTQGVFDAAIGLNTLKSLAGTLLPEELTPLRSEQPLKAAGSFAIPVDAKLWNLAGTLQAERVRYRKIEMGQAKCSVAVSAKQLAVSNLLTRLGVTGSEDTAGGGFVYDFAARTLSGDFDFQGNPLFLFDVVGLPPIAGLTIGHSTATVHLDPSPLPPTQWLGRIKAETASLAWATCQSGAILAEADFAPGKVHLSRLVAKDGGTPSVGCIHLLGDLTYDGNGDAALTWRARFNPLEDREPIEINDGYTLAGTATWKDRKLVTDFSGMLFADQAYGLISRPLGIPGNTIAPRIRSHGTPVTLSNGHFRLPAGNDAWGLEVDLAVANHSYGDWMLKQGTSKLTVSPNHFLFANINGTSSLGETVENVDIRLNFHPLQLTITGRGKVDPRFAEVFIDPPDAKKIYRRLWNDLIFDAANPPSLELQRLFLFYDVESETCRTFELDVHAESQGLQYRDRWIDSAKFDIHVRIPGGVTIEHATIGLDGGQLTGSFNLVNSQPMACEFEAAAEAIDPKTVLYLIQPGWEDILSDFSVGGKVHTTCSGVVDFSRIAAFHLAGTLATDHFSYLKIPLEKAAGTWSVANSSLIRWDLTQAELWGGQVNSTGNYDTATRSGLFALRFNNLLLRDVVRFGLKEIAIPEPAVKKKPATAETAKSTDYDGRLGGDFRLQVFKDWAGVPVQFAGNGRCRVSETSLWGTPLFSSLAKQLSETTPLGRITQIDANFDFNGQQIDSNFETDGTVLALAGEGKYSLRNHDMNFRINGRALKEMKFASWIFKPFSWLLEVELHGTPQNYQWYFVRGVKGWFSSAPDILELDDYKPRSGNP
jgi:hypothetical protein